MPRDLTINPSTTQFFMAVCKRGMHAFIMVGTYEDFQPQQIFSRVGKFFDNEGKHGCLHAAAAVTHIFFQRHKSFLLDESLLNIHYPFYFTYQAFDITYQQYLEYLCLLENIQNTRSSKQFKYTHFFAYKPTGNADGDKVTFCYTDDECLSSKQDFSETKNHLEQLHINNTCRHSAIRIVETTKKSPISSVISCQFFYNLPCESKMYNAYCISSHSSQPFYVFPDPPAAYPDLSSQHRHMLEKIFSRMEQLVRLEPRSLETQSKFRLLKQLYVEKLGTQKEVSLEALLVGLQVWKMENYDELKVLRKRYFWDDWITRQSATMNMANELESGLKRALTS